MLKYLSIFPFGITNALTDNGLEFINCLLKYKKGKYCTKPIKLDMVCQLNQIDYRWTKRFTPKANGMVEKVNDIIKNKTIKITKHTIRNDESRFNEFLSKL